MDHINETHRIN